MIFGCYVIDFSLDRFKCYSIFSLCVWFMIVDDCIDKVFDFVICESIVVDVVKFSNGSVF